ncbi:sorting and assembly machinery component 50 homolog B [Strongylocentrotus purpuratus]|uniref:POTRA domain-containing protein n=1 Tax=Strongylocentrotus purpuratus TaxID=7668 RepID=A0A7M7P5B8_STRPU|nr:sorting and assembly machinery component 50 homolog B [Strongylocentrotus purpuratus]
MGQIHAKEITSEERPTLDEEDPALHKHVFDGNNPVKVEHVHIDGLGRTKDDLVIRHMKDVLQAKTFKEVIQRTGEAKVKLEGLGVFKSVGVFIDTSKGDGSSAKGLDVTFNVKETRRLTGSAHTAVGNNEGSLVLGAKLPNTFGRAESLVAEYSRGTKHSSGFNVMLVKPIGQEFDKRLRGSVFKSSADYAPSSYRETGRGVTLDFTFPSFVGMSELQWEGVWRELSCLTRTASFATREQSGHSLKSSLKHTLTRDTRDERIYPSEGYLLKLSQEVAGYTGGDVKFWKEQIQLQVNKSLFWNCVLSGSLQGGVMKGISDTEVRLNDRFFVGGPTTVRGFNIHGLGPHTQGDYQGGEAFWAGALHLYTPLPFIKAGRGGFGDVFRTHFFVNAGNLTTLDTNNMFAWEDHLQKLRQNFRWSYGAGLVLRIGSIARFELNYCMPQAAQATDSICQGLQFGIGVNFL